MWSVKTWRILAAPVSTFFINTVYRLKTNTEYTILKSRVSGGTQSSHFLVQRVTLQATSTGRRPCHLTRRGCKQLPILLCAGHTTPEVSQVSHRYNVGVSTCKTFRVESWIPSTNDGTKIESTRFVYLHVSTYMYICACTHAHTYAYIYIYT